MNLLFKGKSSVTGFLAALDAYRQLELDAHTHALAQNLLGTARQARLSRDIPLLELVSDSIIELIPDSSADCVAEYYRAYCLHARGRTEEGHRLLSSVLERVGAKYKPRVLLSLAAMHFESGDPGACAPIYIETAKAAQGLDLLSSVQALRGFAVTRAIAGDHESALAKLQDALPIAQAIFYWYPANLYDHLNSIAIELGELGRVEEASRLIDQVLCSPFARNSPHWLDTKLELASKPRRVFAPFAMALGAIEPTEEPFAAELSPRSKKSAARNKTADVRLKSRLLPSLIGHLPTQGEPITAHSKTTHQTLSGYSPSRPIRGPPPLSTRAYAQLIMAIGSN